MLQPLAATAAPRLASTAQPTSRAAAAAAATTASRAQPAATTKGAHSMLWTWWSTRRRRSLLWCARRELISAMSCRQSCQDHDGHGPTCCSARPCSCTLTSPGWMIFSTACLTSQTQCWVRPLYCIDCVGLRWTGLHAGLQPTAVLAPPCAEAAAPLGLPAALGFDEFSFLLKDYVSLAGGEEDAEGVGEHSCSSAASKGQALANVVVRCALADTAPMVQPNKQPCLF